MKELYNLRWQIEINYHMLKESVKIEAITSRKEELIKQDIYSQMLVFNILQTFAEDVRKEIAQSKYKHEMRIKRGIFAFCLFFRAFGLPKIVNTKKIQAY